MKDPPGFNVAAERCDQCLFSKDALVSNERRREILEECATRGAEKHFICHKFTLDGGRNVCCRGFYDHNPEATAAMQVAGRLGLVNFIPLPKEKR